MFPPGSVIAIDSKRNGDVPPEPPPASSGKQRKFHSNQHTRENWVRMFVSGSGIWKVSRAHNLPAGEIEQAIRERLIRAAWIEKRRAA
jgi:hypothetical protein